MKRLYRSRKNRVFTGVCGGLGEYADMDPVVVRIIFVLATLFLGLPLLVYLVAIFVIPLEPLEGGETAAPAERGTTSAAGTGGTSVRQGMPMEEHVRILGYLYIAFSALGLVAAFIVFVAVTGGGWISGDETTIAITTLVGSIIAGVLVLFAAPGIIGGMGLLRKQAWARILIMVLGVLNLFNIPFGTALGIYTIWVLSNKETEAVFSSQAGSSV
jgi:phage shock protein PspC (stress-responsive transcriptional regulator)